MRRNSYDIKAKKTVNMDDLVYGYSGNQLKKVEDAGSSSGFKNDASVNAEYLYAANGNMTRDLNKGIKDIKYNELNLPESISFADGRKISYIYEYNICDHLGNVRAVVDGAGTVKQQSNYYPFGGVFAQAGKSDNKYLYNGKEKQEGTDWLDYGARMYSADLGRFMTVDPLSESRYWLSAYNYCQNNPISRIDPDGMLDDEFRIFKNGDIVKLEKSGEDKVIIMDADGNDTEKVISIGSDNRLIHQSNGRKTYNMLMINDSTKAKEVFKEIASNTNVEHVLVNYTDSSGGKKSVIGNQGTPSKINATGIAMAFDKNGNSVSDITHNHPRNTPPSGYDVSTGIVYETPKGDAKSAINHPRNGNNILINRYVYRATLQIRNKYDKDKYYSGTSF